MSKPLESLFAAQVIVLRANTAATVNPAPCKVVWTYGPLVGTR